MSLGTAARIAAWITGLIRTAGGVPGGSTVISPACCRLRMAFQVRCGSGGCATSLITNCPAALVVNTAPGIPCPSSSAASVTSDRMLTPGDRCSAYSAENVQVTAAADVSARPASTSCFCRCVKYCR